MWWNLSIKWYQSSFVISQVSTNVRFAKLLLYICNSICEKCILLKTIILIFQFNECGPPVQEYRMLRSLQIRCRLFTHCEEKFLVSQQPGIKIKIAFSCESLSLNWNKTHLREDALSVGRELTAAESLFCPCFPSLKPLKEVQCNHGPFLEGCFRVTCYYIIFLA